MRMAMTVGVSALRAFLKTALISSFVFAATPAQPNALAVATTSSPGRSSAGTLGVFSRIANSLRMAYSSLQGTM